MCGYKGIGLGFRSTLEVLLAIPHARQPQAQAQAGKKVLKRASFGGKEPREVSQASKNSWVCLMSQAL